MRIPLTSGMVLISEGAYRLLLQLYPRDFRDEWGLHMSRTFRDCSREQYQRDGIPGLLGLWMFTAMDLIKTALEERAHTGEWFVSKETLIRTGSPAMMIAGVLWMVASMGQFQTIYWDTFGGVDVVYEAAAMLFAPALVMQWIGLLALNAYASRSGAWLTRSIAVLAAALNGMAVLTFILMLVIELEILWAASYLLMTVLFLMLVALGFRLLRESLLPRWNGLPLLLNVPVAVFLLLGFLPNFGIVEWTKPNPWVSFSIFVITGLGLLLLGAAMLPFKRHAVSPAQP